MLGVCLIVVSIVTWAVAGYSSETAPVLTVFFAVVPGSIGLAYLLGWRWGCAGALASGVLAWFAIVPPPISFEFADVRHKYYLVVIIGLAVAASVAVSRLRRGVE